jgi:hypothetical protein
MLLYLRDDLDAHKGFLSSIRIEHPQCACCPEKDGDYRHRIRLFTYMTSVLASTLLQSRKSYIH